MSSNLEEAMDVVIPVLGRDLPALDLSIKSLRLFSGNKIGIIYIAGINEIAIQRFCKKNNCEFVDERQLGLPSKKSISYRVNGLDRSGWLFQQLIKLSADQLINTDYFLVCDADTILLRPQIFLSNDKMILNCSMEYHEPYFIHLQKLLRLNSLMPCSFVSHHMIFNRTILCELKAKIERLHSCSWTEAILRWSFVSKGKYYVTGRSRKTRFTN